MEVKGIITAMVTPMNQDGSINYEATKAHIDSLIEQGVHGLFILGTNGEFHVLSDEEKVEFAREVVSYTDSRVPVYVGIGQCGTLETIRLAEKMKDIPISAYSIITPFLVKVSQQELVNHYQTIADNVDTPILMYNIPVNTGMNLDKETVEILANHPNIVGIKDSSGNLDNLKDYIEVGKDKEFSVLVGSDSKVLAGLQLGASGAVASTSNVIAPTLIEIYNDYKTDPEKVETLQNDVDVIRATLKLGSVPAGIKRCVSLKGIDVGDPRLPILPLKETDNDEVRKTLDYYSNK